VSPIISRQIDAVGFVVCGQDNAGAVEYWMFANVLLIAGENIRRRRGIAL
jgi:hypothetical protein